MEGKPMMMIMIFREFHFLLNRSTTCCFLWAKKSCKNFSHIANVFFFRVMVKKSTWSQHDHPHCYRSSRVRQSFIIIEIRSLTLHCLYVDQTRVLIEYISMQHLLRKKVKQVKVQQFYNFLSTIYCHVYDQRDFFLVSLDLHNSARRYLQQLMLY